VELTSRLPSVSLDPGILFFSLITSGVGFVLFMYGKKQGRGPQLVAGLVLMVYPYFVPDLLWNIVVFVVVVAVTWILVRQGW
jgi:hypothetical protein